jgi:hypothetical protein
MFKYNAPTLKKLEELYREAGFQIRYEKGHFQSGYCLLEERRVIVVNRYYTTEARINTLLELLGRVDIDRTLLSETSLAWLEKAGAQNASA